MSMERLPEHILTDAEISALPRAKVTPPVPVGKQMVGVEIPDLTALLKAQDAKSRAAVLAEVRVLVEALKAIHVSVRGHSFLPIENCAIGDDCTCGVHAVEIALASPLAKLTPGKAGDGAEGDREVTARNAQDAQEQP